MRGRQVIAVVDNDSARDAAVRGYSPSLPSVFLVAALWQALARAKTDVWFDRVPGASNLADGPSRLDYELVRELGAVQVHVRESDWEAVAPPREKGEEQWQ